MQLYSLTIFRAIAVVLVVFGHTGALGAIDLDNPAELFVRNLLSGATTLFVFISGFLFHHVFLKKFEYGSFLKKKLVNLGIPYLVLSSVAVAVGCTLPVVVPHEVFLDQPWLVGFRLATGASAIAYWYVPFVLTLFAMSPLHARFANLSLRWQLTIIAVLLGVALFIHRPPANISPVQNLFYHSPAYLIGIFCSKHRERIYPLLAKYMWPLLATVVGLAGLQAALGNAGNSYKPALEFAGLDLMLVQKLCLALFLLPFLQRFEGRRSKTVDILAETSFAIFFLHPIFMQLFLSNPLLAPLLAQESWPLYFAASVLCVGTCAALALWARRLFGQQSRLLTGY
ncbi:MAG TPA: acyltransferase [Hyphomonadaceae bacterium]|jgi:surface polysaccharide O-acyltransferase-like enzyme|nr:acyltransferase [Hyphomonadaceae bacterium]